MGSFRREVEERENLSKKDWKIVRGRKKFRRAHYHESQVEKIFPKARYVQ